MNPCFAACCTYKYCLESSRCSSIWLPVACGKDRCAITVAGTSVGFGACSSVAFAIERNKNRTSNPSTQVRRQTLKISINHFTVQDAKPHSHFASEPTIPPGTDDSLLRRDSYTTGGVQRRTNCARLKRHESMVIGGIDRDTVRIGSGRHVVQPLVRAGIDYAHHRGRKHIARCEIVSVVTRVVPGFVHASNLRDFEAVDE